MSSSRTSASSAGTTRSCSAASRPYSCRCRIPTTPRISTGSMAWCSTKGRVWMAPKPCGAWEPRALAAVHSSAPCISSRCCGREDCSPVRATRWPSGSTARVSICRAVWRSPRTRCNGWPRLSEGCWLEPPSHWSRHAPERRLSMWLRRRTPGSQCVKVLFVDNPFSRPTDGGGYTFQQLLLGGLKRMHSRHDCSYVQPEAHKGVVQALVQRNQIDFVWFISLYHESVPVPFASTVWDLGHREMPWFPELSLSGWTFQQREQHYREVLPRASLIAVGNAVGAQAIQQFYRIPAERICEIALPVDTATLAAVPADAAAVQELGLVPGRYLLYPAQFWPHKNHITLIDML